MTTVECLRASLKVLVLYLSKQRILLNGGQVAKPIVAEAGAGVLADPSEPATPRVPMAADHVPTRWSKGSRTGVCLPVPASFGKTVKVQGSLDEAAAPVHLTAELLNISRPLVYLLAR